MKLRNVKRLEKILKNNKIVNQIRFVREKKNCLNLLIFGESGLQEFEERWWRENKEEIVEL